MVVFWGVHSQPGNAFISDRVHGQSLQLLLHEYGLDRPLPVQYWDFITNLVHYGKFGNSLQIRGININGFIFRELSVSALLGGSALIITLGLGMLFGILAAVRHNTWVDYVLTTIAVIGYSVPSFVIATVGILVFGVWLENVTHGAFFYPIEWTGTYGNLAELSLPAISLGFYTSGQVTRITRAAMLDVVQQDYIRTAWAKGLKSRVVILRHAFRNALIPVMSVGGPLVVSLLTGSVIIENIFQIPGLGKEFVNSIFTHDYNVTVAVSMLYVGLVAVANLVVDIGYAVVDPRIRY